MLSPVPAARSNLHPAWAGLGCLQGGDLPVCYTGGLYVCVSAYCARQLGTQMGHAGSTHRRPPPKLMCVARTAGSEVSPPTTLSLMIP